MTNNLLPKQGRQSLFDLPLQGPLFTRSSDYSELGQRYRRKAIWAGLAMAAYMVTLFIVIFNAMSR